MKRARLILLLSALVAFGIGPGVALGQQIDELASVGAKAAEEARSHYDKGIVSHREGKIKDAIEELTEALHLEPDFLDARKELGSLLLEQKRYIDASILYGDGVRIHPKNADAHNDWGVALIKIGNLPDATKAFSEAVRLKPNHVDAQYNLGVALFDAGKVDEAVEHFEAALRLQPVYADAHFAIGRALHRQGKEDEAIGHLREVLRLRPNYPNAQYEFGQALMAQGKVREAIRRLTEAVRTDPVNFDARFGLGLALKQYGNDAAALPQFIEAVRLESKNADAHYQLAMALAGRGRIEEAIAHNDQALFLRPDWPEVLNNQAWILATTSDPRLRDPQRALELAERAKLVADFKMPRMLDTLAAAQAAAGNYKRAQQTAAKAIEWAKATDQTPLAEQIEARLKLYRDGRPNRDDVDATTPGS